ncbi:hypothetical protein JJQ59_04900 [Cupriavidus necator]|uniref:hypothetical protein n=1 Tax=Cupriavidus necator TaxID=106590 RepID=UPI0011BDE417|nr:hypothetical protein [Cupriavidus necator]QQX85282.1 hypothetical protein JJQ59_04900 [Cupriavidus necator]
MQAMTPDAAPAIRTTLHLSPAVCAAAMVSAQAAGLGLTEWLDHIVAAAVQETELQDAPPLALPTAELFCRVANNSPELLQGRWALLYERVCLERDLWHSPRQTVGQIEDGEPPFEPYISASRLRKAWPRLVAATFCC